jgi:uncharacterized protein with HEPN domain
MKEDKLYLLHIQESILRIKTYVIDGKQQFVNSTLIQDAVLRNLQTLSESTQRLSDEFKNRYPDIPWRELWTFRNVVAHNYLGINLDRIWEVIDQDLPILEQQFNRINEIEKTVEW